VFSLSVRAKLMCLYLVVTFAGLSVFGLLSFVVMRYTLIESKKTHLQGREERLITFLRERREKGDLTPLAEKLQNYALVTHEGSLVRIHNLDGSLMFPISVVEDWRPKPGEMCGNPLYDTTVMDHEPTLVMCHQIFLEGHPVVLSIGGSLEEETAILNRYRSALLLLAPGLFLVSSICGYFLSRHAMKPVDRMTKAALGIGIGNLSERLPVPKAKDEIQALAVAWNQLLTRLEAAVSRLSQFSADASHDLRTSITVMLATAQLSLHRPREEWQYRSDLAKIVTECHTASTLLDALLSLAQSDNFVHEVALQNIDLCELVVNGCRRVEDLAEASGIILDWSLPPENVSIQGDGLLLQRLLGILLDNAIRYTPEGGQVTAEILPGGEEVTVAVRDTGIGMSEEVQKHVFERFYQADLRERKTRAGNGLGLSIGRWIAEAHGAELSVESTPLRGSIFRIRFPHCVLDSVAKAETRVAGVST